VSLMAAVVKLVRSSSFGRRRSASAAEKEALTVTPSKRLPRNSRSDQYDSMEALLSERVAVTPYAAHEPKSSDATSRSAGLSFVKAVRSASFGTRHDRRRANRKTEAAAPPAARAPLEEMNDHQGLKLLLASSHERSVIEARQQRAMDEAMYAFGGGEVSPKAPAEGDQFDWLTQQMRQIDAGEQKEKFQEKLQNSRQIRAAAFQRDSEVLQARLKKMKTQLPAGLPPGLPPPPPIQLGKTLINGVGFEDGEYVDAPTLEARADTSAYSDNYTAPPPPAARSTAAAAASAPVRAAAGHQVNYEDRKNSGFTDGSLSRI